ncbi:MAG: hypothetical protein ACKN9T_09680, partial [Candidatus Methylumidiphilus sp.]
ITRYLVDDDVLPSAVWQSVGHFVRRSGNACLIFDDTVLDKRYSFKIELVRRQYSGNEHGVIKGIGVANCLYVNLDTNEYWIIDWRIYDPDGDGKNKLDHVRDMLDDAIAAKNLPFRAVLMDSWCATKDLEDAHPQGRKTVYCPLKANRKVDGSGGKNPYKAVSSLDWFDDEMLRGKLVKIHGFPMGYKVKLFRVAATNRTEYVATNDLSQDSAVAVQRHVRNPLESRAIPPRRKTNSRPREMPMPQGPRTEKPHRLRDTRLALPDKSRKETRSKHLRTEKWTSLLVYEKGT